LSIWLGTTGAHLAFGASGSDEPPVAQSARAH
jgi:hypothetical protein